MIIGLTVGEEAELKALLKQTIRNTTQEQWDRVLELNRKVLDGLETKINLGRLNEAKED